MSWNNPRTWLAGEKPTAATMNAHIRDNLNYLYPTWTAFTPTWTGVTLGTTGLVNDGRYITIGKRTDMTFSLTLGAGGLFTGNPFLTLPGTPNGLLFTSIGTALMMDSGSSTTRRLAMAYLATATSVTFVLADNPAGTANVGATLPWTWGAGDMISGTVTFEQA